MSDSEEPQQENGEDAIKAAVREATKKTQERLAAYQKKQAANKAKAAEEKPVTKQVAQAEDTVAKLQALVGESRRLTAKSKEKTKEVASIGVAPPTTGLHRSSSLGTETMSHQTPKGKRMSAAAAVTKLNSSSSNLSYSSNVNTPKTPGLKRSVTVDSAKVTTPSALTPGGSLAKGKKLGAIFQSLNKNNNNNSNQGSSNLNGSLADLTAGISKLASDDFIPNKEAAGYLSPNKGKSIRKAPMKSSIKEEDLNDISVSSHEMIDAIEIDEDDYDEEEQAPVKSAKQQSKKKKRDKSKGSGAHTDDGGEFSIFSLVDDGMKQTAKTAGVEGLRDDEMQDLMEDYYTEPVQTGPSEDESEDMEKSMALLELQQDQPKPEKPKGKKKKKGKTTDDISTEKRSKKESKKLGKSMSSFNEEPEPVDEDMDCSMPMLAPFETPKVHRPKLMQALANNEISTSNLNFSRKSPLPSNEESLNLSQIMRQPDIMPDQASSRSTSPHRDRSSSKGRSGSHRRKSNGMDDDKSSRSKSKKSSRRSSLTKNSSDHKKNEEIASRAISAYHRKDGQGSSTLEGLNVCEKTGDVLGSTSKGLDISAISEDSGENDSSMQDGSDSMGGSLGGSSHSARSNRSMSRSSRRGRTTGGGDRSGSRGVSRSRGGRPRSASRTRSASVRRSNTRGRRGSNLGADDDKSRRSRRASIAGTKADSNNDSMRGDRSMRDVSSRRARLQASARDPSMRDGSRRDNRSRRSISTRRPGRRNQRGGSRPEDESERDLEQSQHSTAEEILGSLDVSDIKIVGADSTDSNEEKKAAKKSKNSLALLSKLESAAPSNDNDDDGVSVSESVQSAATKKSKMGKFARKMGRRLTMKKKKDKKGDDDDSDDDNEEEGEEADLALLAAEYDEEEKELYEKSGNLHESFSKGDFSVASVMDDLTTDDDSDNKKSTKKKQRASVFGKFKIGKMGGGKKKKDKKKDKKPKGSKALESDSESDNSDSSEDEKDELLGSEYSSQSESHDEEMEDSNEEAYAQLQIDGDNKSSVVTSDSNDHVGRNGRVPRRASAITSRRQRANQQRSMSLHQALEQGSRGNARGGGDEGSVSTAAAMRNRRARSLRGKVVRKSDVEAAPPGSRLTVDVKRAKSLKGRIEGEAAAATKGGKKIRRTRSVEFEKMGGGDANDGEAPAFDWTAYSNQKEAPLKENGAARRNISKRKSHAERRKSQADKRMSGGLSKIIYASQPVTS